MHTRHRSRRLRRDERASVDPFVVRLNALCRYEKTHQGTRPPSLSSSPPSVPARDEVPFRRDEPSLLALFRVARLQRRQEQQARRRLGRESPATVKRLALEQKHSADELLALERKLGLIECESLGRHTRGFIAG